MDVRWMLLLLFTSFGSSTAVDIGYCLKIDSISCLQMQIFKAVQLVLNQQSIEIAAGFSLIKNVDGNNGSSETQQMEERIIEAQDVETRQSFLEDYFINQAKRIWNDREVVWNTTQAARSFASDSTQKKYSNIFNEARGKAKKQLKMLVPFLLLAGLKVIGFAVLSYMAIAVIAKKAILAGLISLLVSGIIGIKSLLGKQHIPLPNYGPPKAYYGSTGYNTGSYGNYGDELLANSNQPEKPEIFYSGQ